MRPVRRGDERDWSVVGRDGTSARGRAIPSGRGWPPVRRSDGPGGLVLGIVAAITLALAPSSAAAQTKVLGPGGWSYFGDPRAVHAGGRTFVGYTDTDGYIRLAELEKGRVLRQRRLRPR